MEATEEMTEVPTDTMLKSHQLGSWRLPSGNEVKGFLLYRVVTYGFHTEISEEYPFLAADLHAYSDFVLPEVKDKAEMFATGCVERASRESDGMDANNGSQPAGDDPSTPSFKEECDEG